MKKRLISLLLTVVMLMSLCTALGTGASAEANVTTVKVASGDTIVGLCGKLGVDFYTYKNLIMNLNGFTSETQLSRVSIGQDVVLPSSAAAAAVLANNGSAQAATLSAGTTTAAAPVAAYSAPASGGQVTNIPAGDRVAYYLVDYTIQKNETIQGIYTNWGLSYKTFDSQIKKLNNITSYTSIAADRTLLLPTTSPAVAGSTYYTVMAHVMRNGESAYDIISNQYGMNYNANQSLITALNSTNNLESIRANSELYIPVSGVVTASTAVSTTTATPVTTATVSTGGVYNLVSQTAVNGSFDLQIDGNSATTAQAGKTVRVVTAPNFGYTVDTIRVTKVGDTSYSVGVSNGYFTMPSFSVIVAVTFKTAKAYGVEVAKTSNGSVSAMVGGTQVSKAYVGNTVTVRTIPDTGFMLDYVRVSYNNGKDSVAVYNNTFVMPDTDVQIVAVFTKDPNYDPSLGHALYTSVENGTIETYVGNEKTKFANAGDRVYVSVTPLDNYVIESVVVYYDNFKKTADMDKGSFTMPDSPVTIVASIKAKATATFAISKVDSTNGYFAAYIGDTEVTEAKIGSTVDIYGTPRSSAYWYVVTVFKTGDMNTIVPVTQNADGSYSFEMPDYPVSVHCKFYLYHKVILDASNGIRGSYLVLAGNTPVSQCASGVELSVYIYGINGSYAASNVILTYADGSSYTLNGMSFIMPDCDVKVKVNFTEKQSITAHAATMNGGYGAYGNTYTVGNMTLNGNRAAKVYLNAGVGQNVVVYTTPALGYQVSVNGINYTYTDPAGNVVKEIVEINPVSRQYQFEMPEIMSGTSLNLYVDFTEVVTYAINLDYESGYVSPDSNRSQRKGTFAVSMLSHSAYVDHATAGQRAQIHCFPASGYAVDSANIKVINETTGKEVEINRNDYSFTMPESPVRVIVPFCETEHYIRLLRANDGVDGKPKGTLGVIIDGYEYLDNDLQGDNYSTVPYKFPVGTLVTVVNKSRTGFVLDSSAPILVSKVIDGTPVSYKTLDGDHFSFEMPNADVIVSAQYIDDMVAINAAESTHGSYRVPAQVVWNGSFTVTDIAPEEGYELDRILISYVDHDGESHVREELIGTTVDLSSQKGMLGSDITVEVLFKAALNPMTIKYIFDDAPDPNSIYKVDLLVDGKVVEGIERNHDLSDYKDSSKYADRLRKFKDETYIKESRHFVPEPPFVKIEEEELTKEMYTGYGIATGKTVVISRNESKPDKNFDIVNIWVTLDNGASEPVAIKPEFSNNQYYFTMPYVSSGLSDDLTLYIEYAKSSSDAYNLSIYKANGDGEISSWQFTVDGDKTNKATASAKDITLELVIPDYCEIKDTDVVVRYTDSDGVSHPTAAEEAEKLTLVQDSVDENKWTVSFNNTDGKYPDINSMPLNKAVSLEYSVERKAYDLPADVLSAEDGITKVGTASFTVDGAAAVKAKWGKEVVMTVAPNAGNVLSDIRVYDNDGNEITVNKSVDGMYQFVMPKYGCRITAKSEKAAHTVRFNNTSGVEDIHAIFVVNGTEYIDQVAVNKGTEVKFYFQYPDNYKVSDVKDTVSGTPITPDSNGIYTGIMPDADAVIEGKFTEKTYTMRVVPDVGGVSNLEYTVYADGVKLTPDTKDEKGYTYTDKAKSYVTYTIEPPAVPPGELKYEVSGATIEYRDMYDNPVLEYAAVDGEGNASFSFSYIPKEGEEILVIASFNEDTSATYAIKWMDDAVAKKYSLYCDVADTQYVSAGTTVYISMTVKYYKILDETNFNDFMKLEYNVGGNKQEVPLTLYSIGNVEGYNQGYICTGWFTMPGGDVTVSIDESALKDDKQVYLTAGSEKVYTPDGPGNMKEHTGFNLDETCYVWAGEKIDDTNWNTSTATVNLYYLTEDSKEVNYAQTGTIAKQSDGYYYIEFKLERNPSDTNKTIIPLASYFTVTSNVVVKP